MSLFVEKMRMRTGLLWQLTVREIEGRYRGSLLGMAWAILSPLIMLVVYTYVFSIVFKARWGANSGDRVDFALMVYCGMVVFGLFAELVNAAPRIILNQVNYVKKVVFPLELLPLAQLGGALFNAMIGFALLFTVVFFKYGISYTVIFVPFVLIPFIFFLIGVGWFLSALGVYLRDLGQAVAPVIGVLQFMSPIFYSADSVPESFGWFMKLSPLTWPVTALRDCLLLHTIPKWDGFLYYFIFGIIVLIAGWYFFMKSRRGFADVV